MDGSEKNKENLVTVRTEQLKDRLNRVYSAVRGKSGQINRFDYLWDLKELAVLEKRGSVQIPDTWLDELEKVYVEAGEGSRGH